MSEYYPAVTNFSGHVELDMLLTNRCNFRCRHCLYTGQENKQDLPKDTIHNLFQQLRGTDTDIHLLGGEPLCREDIVEVVTQATEFEFTTQILTNGYAATDCILTILQKAGLKAIGFSVDGPEHTHNYNRRKKDAFNRVINAIRSATELGYRPKVSTAVHSANKDSIPELLLILNDLRVERILIEYVLPLGRGRRLTGKNLTSEEWWHLIENLSIFKKKEGLSLRIAIQAVFFDANNGQECLTDCICRDGKYPVVDAFGYYYPCIIFYAARYPQGNISKTNWCELNNPEAISLFLKRTMEKLNRKNYLKISCPAVRLMIQNDRLNLDNIFDSSKRMGCFHNVIII